MEWDKVAVIITAIIAAYGTSQGAKAAEANRKAAEINLKLKEMELKEKQKDANRGNGKHPKR